MNSFFLTVTILYYTHVIKVKLCNEIRLNNIDASVNVIVLEM